MWALGLRGLGVQRRTWPDAVGARKLAAAAVGAALARRRPARGPVLLEAAVHAGREERVGDGIGVGNGVGVGEGMLAQLRGFVRFAVVTGHVFFGELDQCRVVVGVVGVVGVVLVAVSVALVALDNHGLLMAI